MILQIGSAHVALRRLSRGPAVSIYGAYAVLAGAVVFEVIGTSALLASQHFSRPWPVVVVVVCYAVALIGISFTFRFLQMGMVYAIWSGLGIVLIASVGWYGFGQRIDVPGVLGLGMIVGGILVINLFSKSLIP